MKPHIVFLPCPGMGHIIPLLELAKLLVTRHGFHVSFLVINTETSPAQSQLLKSSTIPSDLHVIDLPAADVSNLVADESFILTRLCLMVQQSLHPLRSILTELNRPNAVIVDMFTTQAFEICDEHSIPVYSFFTGPASLLTFSLYLPILDREVEGGFVDLPEPVQVPGCRPIRTEDLLDPVKNRKIEEYKWYLFHVSRLTKFAGIIVNSWEDLEPVSLLALKENRFFQDMKIPPVYPIGPVIKQDEPVSESEKEILNWLDKQPSDSVIFVALGSGGTLSSEQFTELALGLELSQQRFILVARKPTDSSSKAVFFNSGSQKDDPAEYLPEGFVERTKGVGLVVPSWAPQAAVLRHESTGGFLSHCGWNSSLESVFHGVPMVAWPLYAEQRMNAAALEDEVGVAVKPVVEMGRGVVVREEVERVVRLVMEDEKGKVMRRRARELRDSALKALDIGGSSYDSLALLVEGWKSGIESTKN